MLVFCFFILTNSQFGFGSELVDGNCGIIYGKNHSFSICAPEGWVLDNKSGVSQGLYAVFYPLGKSWKDSDVVMYVNWAAKDPVIKDVEILVEFNLNKFRKNGSPNVKAEFLKAIDTDSHKKGQIWKYSGDKWANNELVCYFDENHGIAMIILTTQNKNIFEISKQAFDKIVTSYCFISDTVNIE
jgi:hypothetical protein